MHIGNMHFYHWSFNSSNGITNSNRCMSICTGVYDDAIIIKSYPLQLIHQLTFNIALKIGDAVPGKFLFELLQVFFKRYIAINIGLPLTQQVKIRSIDDGYSHILI